MTSYDLFFCSPRLSSGCYFFNLFQETLTQDIVFHIGTVAAARFSLSCTVCHRAAVTHSLRLQCFAQKGNLAIQGVQTHFPFLFSNFHFPHNSTNGSSSSWVSFLMVLISIRQGWIQKKIFILIIQRSIKAFTHFMCTCALNVSAVV